MNANQQRILVLGIGILVLLAGGWSCESGLEIAARDGDGELLASVTRQDLSTEGAQVVRMIPHNRATVRKYTVVTTAAHVARGLRLPALHSGDMSRLYMVVSAETTCGGARYWYSKDELDKARREGFAGDDMGDIGFTLTWFDGTAHVGYTVPCDPTGSLQPVTYDYEICIVDAAGSLCGTAVDSVQVM